MAFEKIIWVPGDGNSWDAVDINRHEEGLERAVPVTDWVVKRGSSGAERAPASGEPIYGNGATDPFIFNVTPPMDSLLEAKLRMESVTQYTAAYYYSYVHLTITPAPAVGPTLTYGPILTQHTSVQTYEHHHFDTPPDIKLLKDVNYTLTFAISKNGGDLRYAQSSAYLWAAYRLRKA